MTRANLLRFAGWCGVASIAVAAVMAMAAPAATAAAASSATQGDPRLGGSWDIDAIFRSDAEYNSHAVLTPAGQDIQRRNAEVQKDRLAHGEAVGLGSYTCGKQGVPFITGTSEPWLLVLTKDEVVQFAERRQMIARHIYMDGRSWPDLSKMPPSVNGYSIGHWEGKELVIETRGMPSGGSAGRGLKGPSTVLTERVSVNADGKQLMWTYIWTDPVLLAKPTVFTLKYDRSPPHTYAYTHPCDPNEGAGRTVSEPKQD
jgi:hypothetical protein